jgi:hypothetical protein
MSRIRQRSLIGRFAWAMLVICAIALVLILSMAITVSAGHALDHLTLALPIFFVLLLLATSTGEWLASEDFFLAANPPLTTCFTRGPPA